MRVFTSLFKCKHTCFNIAVSFLAMGFAARASSVTTVVSATDMPWMWSNGGLNTNFQFGDGSGTGPAILGSSSGISFAAGSVITIDSLSGQTSTCGSCPFVDAGGWTAAPANGGLGSSGFPYPSKYMSPYPIYLMELVGTFANSSGAIVGTPFAIGNGPSMFTVPAGATQLQLGLNDDKYSDDAGALTVQISGSAATSTPEPASVVLSGMAFAAGLGLCCLRKLRFRRPA